MNIINWGGKYLPPLQTVEKVNENTGGRGKPSHTPKFFPFLQTSNPIPWLAVL
ncbi:MAG: hypothetical protein ACI3YH_03600 [Eubacteriales bacterium]